MANGKFANGELVAEEQVLMATIDSTVEYASVQLILVNRSSTDTAKIRIAVATTMNVQDSDYIEYDFQLPPNSVYNYNVLVCSPGEKIFGYSDKSGVSFRVGGISK